MLAAFPGNAGKGSPGEMGLTSLGKISEGDHANQPLLTVHHRQSADLLFSHIVSDVVDFFVLENIAHVGGHHLPYFGTRRILALRDEAKCDVTIRYHADKPVTFPHWESPRIGLVHQSGCVLNGILKVDHLDIALHDVGDPRGLSPVFIQLGKPPLQRAQRTLG